MALPVIGIDMAKEPDETVGMIGHVDAKGVLHIEDYVVGSAAVEKMRQRYSRRLAWYNFKSWLSRLPSPPK